MSVLGGETSFALLFESPGLAHVTGDILCMLDLSTFVRMEEVAPFVAKFMASSGIWRRRLLLVEGSQMDYVKGLLSEKAIWRKVVRDELDEEVMHATSRRLCRMLAGYHSEDDWSAKTMRTYSADTVQFGKKPMPGPRFIVSLNHNGICYAHKSIRGRYLLNRKV